MKNLLAKGCLASLALAWPAAVTAQEAEPQPTAPSLTVREIVEQTNRVAYYQGDDGRAKVVMTIADHGGAERTREFIILRRDEPPTEGPKDDTFCRNQKIYVYFERPADVNKMVFLVWKHIDTDDDRWLYLPALDLVKRIAASDKRTSFVGSDFFYEDVSGRSIEDDKHELVETTDTYYVLKSTPKEAAGVAFAYYKMWIHRDTFIPVKIEYSDDQDKVYRVYEALGVEQVQERWTVTKSRMTSQRTNSSTTLTYSDVMYDVGLPDDLFTERYLRRPPRKFLR